MNQPKTMSLTEFLQTMVSHDVIDQRGGKDSGTLRIIENGMIAASRDRRI